MKTMAVKACSEWLADRGIPEAPYGSPQSEQFPLPPEASRSSSVIRRLLEVCCPFGSALLQFTDWPVYEQDEMAVAVALRTSYGEPGPLIDTPGHMFAAGEADLLSGMFSLAAFYHWSAYLYFDHRTIVHCWEGDLLDLWVPDPVRLGDMRDVFAVHSLSSTLEISR